MSLVTRFLPWVLVILQLEATPCGPAVWRTFLVGALRFGAPLPLHSEWIRVELTPRKPIVPSSLDTGNAGKRRLSLLGFTIQ